LTNDRPTLDWDRSPADHRPLTTLPSAAVISAAIKTFALPASLARHAARLPWTPFGLSL